MLLTSPLGAALGQIRGFMDEWYALWRTPEGERRSPDEAHARYERWRTHAPYALHPSLHRVLKALDADHFTQLSAYLRNPRWEATNNGAERTGRAFRHTHASHFQLRTATATAATLNVHALQRREEQSGDLSRRASQASRGRRSGHLSAVRAA